MSAEKMTINMVSPEQHLQHSLNTLIERDTGSTAELTYKFFNELNDICVKLASNITTPKNHKLIISTSKSANTTPNSNSSQADATLNSNSSQTTNHIEQITLQLLKVICTHTKLNQNVLKMVGTVFINCTSLVCNEQLIVQTIGDVLAMEDSSLNLYLTLEKEDSNATSVIPTEILVQNMPCLKIVLAAALIEQNWWHIECYNGVIIGILSTLSAYCCNKFLHEVTFAMQTIKSCLDQSLKVDEFFIDETISSQIFHVVLGNWENYIPSVMEHNLMLFESLIKVLKKKDVKVNKERMWNFLTNVSCTLKSKYYMMATCFLADFYYEKLFMECWFIKNMAYSLSRSYLVTAGAYCHKVITKNIFTEEKWKQIFLDKVIELVCHSDIYIRQNVSNYWLPVAIKYYPNLIQTLYDRTLSMYNLVLSHCLTNESMYCKNRSIDQIQRYLHSVVLIVKLERAAKFTDVTYKAVQEGMQCSNEMIRGDAFLCCQSFNGVKCHVPMSRSNPYTLDCQTFEDIFNFLVENINCDDSNLRQTMYKVFKNYVRNTEGQIHKCVVPIDLIVRHKGKSESFQLPDFMDNYIAQYKQLYTFLMRNLAEGANYQRLITTLNLLNVLFENMQVHMTENQKKKRKPSIEYLKQIGQWQFESAECRERLFSCLKNDTTDVRLMARQVLQSYFSYSNTSEEIVLFIRNIQTSLQMSQSNVFYTAESGAYCVAVLVNLYYKSNFDGRALSGFLTELLNASKETNGLDVYDSLCERIAALSLDTATSAAVLTVGASDQPRNFFCTYFLNQCLAQSNQLQKDILLAVKNKNGLHGSLTTLMLILTDSSSPEYCGLNPEQVQCLLNLLNETCLHMLDILCMKSKSTNFAPSFGEMGEAMDSLINNMSEGDGDSDTLTLTPAHQTLFNCIWMNLKICCTFASELAVAYHGKGLLSRDQIVFSCGIVSHVLHKCRHKGAIQNAGLALAHIVGKCLYDDTYPLDLLNYTLTSVLDCTVGGTVSRKSAGVAILVHKLLASNHSMKDVLFTTAMDKIIQVANSHVESTVETLKVDLPQAVAFHMLQFLVADSGLRVAMATYLEQITMLCFDKMESQEWTVRNAALQVFGALLPKLVGTKKQDSENQSSNVAFEEFFYQLPRIGDCLRSVLSSLHNGHTSVLVSALTLLSRLKTTGHLFPSKQIVDLKHYLSQVYSTMLSSNIYTIRFLVANAYVNTLEYDEFLEQFEMLLFYCLEFIFGSPTLMSSFQSSNIKLFLQNKSRHKITNENHLHATLLALENLRETIYLENLQLDRKFLLELLSFLSSDVRCIANIKFSTYSLLYKIFRQENESLAPDMYTNNIDLFSSVSCLLRKSIKRDIGWKLYAQEVIKFHMSNSLFVGDNIDFNYIVQLIDTFCHESDILADTLVYMARLLEEYNVKTNEKSLINNKSTALDSTQSAQLCIRTILTTVLRSNISRIGLEKIFNLVVQLFIMFVDDKQLSSLVDTGFLNIMDILLEGYFSNSVEFEYMCPVILPVISICILFAGKDNNTLEVEELLKHMPYFTNGFIYNEVCNEEFRYNAALSMSILCEHSLYRSLYGKDVVTNVIHLLQDEVYEVRQEVTYFVRHLQRSFSKNSITKSSSASSSSLLLTNPYVCLFKIILNTNFTHYVDCFTLFDIFSNLLFINEQDIDQMIVDSEFCNPFDHNLRNFYSEPIVIVKHAKTLVTDILLQLDKDVLTEVLVKYNTCIETYSKKNLNQQGRVKLELIKEVVLSLKSASVA